MDDYNEKIQRLEGDKNVIAVRRGQPLLKNKD